MQEKNKKEKWGKPKLIILTRGKPEEGVLQKCHSTNLHTGYNVQQGWCGYAPHNVECADCQVQALS